MFFSLLRALHIFAGVMGLVSGALAMIFRKGSLLHAKAGSVFVASMLTMASSAVYLAAVKHDNNNIGGGVLTFYLVATAWMTARRADGETSVFDWAAVLIPLTTGATSWLQGIQMLRAGGREGPLYIGMSFFMGSMMSLAATGDLRMMVRGGVFGRRRVVRHLWRMCLGFFIATGSFFLGQGSRFFQASSANPAGFGFLPSCHWSFSSSGSSACASSTLQKGCSFRVQAMLRPSEADFPG